MTSEEVREVEDLLEKLESDEVQLQLKQGFQRDFAASFPAQWAQFHTASPRQLEVLRDIVERYDKSSKPSAFSRRRYEGFEGSKK